MWSNKNKWLDYKHEYCSSAKVYVKAFHAVLQSVTLILVDMSCETRKRGNATVYYCLFIYLFLFHGCAFSSSA